MNDVFILDAEILEYIQLVLNSPSTVNTSKVLPPTEAYSLSKLNMHNTCTALEDQLAHD